MQIQGKAATAMYWGAVIITAMSIAALVILTLASKEIPNEITLLLMTAIGFIFGTHTKPETRTLNTPKVENVEHLQSSTGNEVAHE